MWLYFSKEFTAAQNGSTIRDVNCEKCGCAYHYELARTGIGTGSSPYMVNNSAAAARAQRRAIKNLHKLLATEVEAVPCPDCGWIQADMARWLQRGHLRWMFKWSIGLGGVAMLVLFVWWFALRLDRGSDPKQMREVLTWMAMTVGAAGSVIGVRRILASRQDPNRNFPARPRTQPGAPPALVRVESDDPHAPARYAPAREEELTAMAGIWAEVQMQRAVLPDVCCLCLGRPERVFSVPYCLSEQPMRMPLCRSCFRRTQRRWWGWAAISLALAAVVGWVAASFTFGADDFGRVIVGAITFLIAAAILSAIVPTWRVRPYRIRTIDASRGVARVRFANPRYTELFAQQYLEGTTLQAPFIPTPPPKATRVRY